MTDNIFLKFTKNSRNIPEDLNDKIYDLSENGIEVDTNSEDLPLPWDAGLTIEEGNLVIEGHAGPSGYGYAVTKLPLSQISRHLVVLVHPKSEAASDELTDLFMEYGWL